MRQRARAPEAQRVEELQFEDFFRREYPNLVRSLYLLTTSLPEADELAQEAMARAFERWDRVRAMESPGGYVHQTAVNLNRKRLRHLRVRARRVTTPPVSKDEPEIAMLSADLGDALRSLPLGQREAFLLVEWLGLSSDEAGRVLGIEGSSVRSRVHRARAVLRDRLSNEENEDG